MKPVTLEADTKPQPPKRDAQDILGQDSVTRFDASLKKKKKKRRIMITQMKVTKIKNQNQKRK